MRKDILTLGQQGKSGGPYTKGKGPDTEKQILPGLTYPGNQNAELTGAEMNGVHQGVGGEGTGRSW